MLLAKTSNLKDIPKILKQIEKKWTPILNKHSESINANKELNKNTKPRYVLSMFPYPSGNLHLGHVRIYTSSDLIARFSRLQFNDASRAGSVINPMGFDSHGLPAENAARERGIDPNLWIDGNIKTMKKQMKDLSFDFDWRESTSDPNFYRWTQKIFTLMMRSHLVYKTYAQVNWDPVDMTVLADEQVDEEGKSWRSGAKVEKRNHHQWFVKTNSFCHDIYKAEDVNRDYWQDIIDIQRNWIGKPSGWLFYLPIECNRSISDSVSTSVENILLIFTDKPELFLEPDVSLVISDDHWLASFDIQSGIINPFTGDRMNIRILGNSEDKAMLPPNTRATITRDDSDLTRNLLNLELRSENREKILRLASQNKYGGYFTSDKYRDWLISRQRYWGTPIPVTHCPTCHHQPIDDSDLPVELPSIGNMKQLLEERRQKNSLDTSIRSPLREYAPKNWLETTCSNCGAKATRETDTCDTLFDSSWYFLRYATEPSSIDAFDKDRVQPVWCYVGGKEHAAMHLFYARFVTHFLHSQKLLSFREPFERLLVQGVVKSRTYKLKGRYLSPTEVEEMKNTSHPDVDHITEDYEKMSKSKGNGINPQDLLNEYGIDATRFCLLSYVNPDTERLWRSNEEEFYDVLKFLRRISLFFQDLDACAKSDDRLDLSDQEAECDLRNDRNRYVCHATHHLRDSHQFRQYISCLHSLFNTIRRYTSNIQVIRTEQFSKALESFVIMLNPMMPHFSEEIWVLFRNYRKKFFDETNENSLKTLACEQMWPTVDKDYPLMIQLMFDHKVFETISIDQESFRKLSKRNLFSMANDFLTSKGYTFEILQVDVLPETLARITVDLKGPTLNKNSKRTKKKEKK